jgi:hypothetical protein
MVINALTLTDSISVLPAGYKKKVVIDHYFSKEEGESSAATKTCWINVEKTH